MTWGNSGNIVMANFNWNGDFHGPQLINGFGKIEMAMWEFGYPLQTTTHKGEININHSTHGYASDMIINYKYLAKDYHAP